MVRDATSQDITPFQKSSVESDVELIAQTMNSMQEQLLAMEKFVRRRFDEISMEINATSQQLDMAESGLESRFSEILSSMSAISFSGSGLTAANTGVELQAVIADTEEAANRILDAADRMSNRLLDESQLSDEDKRREFLLAMGSDIQDILMACSFQDLAGQRIRKTLESLQIIEEQISTTLGELGIEVKNDPLEGGVRDSTENHAHSQADIDALFS